MRELATNPKQQQNSAYARQFQQEGAHELSPENLAAWVKDRRSGRNTSRPFATQTSRPC